MKLQKVKVVTSGQVLLANEEMARKGKESHGVRLQKGRENLVERSEEGDALVKMTGVVRTIRVVR